MSELSKIYLPILVPVFLAFLGWYITHRNAQRQMKWAAELSYVNDQLRLLYGPLYMHLVAGKAAWATFHKNYWPAHNQTSYFAEGFNLSDAELKKWRHWMVNVFHPMNSNLEKVIVENLHLLDDEDIPEAFTDCLAHIAVYTPVLEQWKDGDYSEHVSTCNFPSWALMNFVEPKYRKLQMRQLELISLTRN